MQKVVIVSAVRTALGSFNGSLSGIGATDLGGIVIKNVVNSVGININEIDEVIMGQVLPCGYGQNPAKQAAIKAGMPEKIEALTVNKVCGSSLKSVMLAAQAIQVGDADVVVAGGMENMSMAPYYLEKARFGYRMGHSGVKDSMINDGLWDNVNDFHMGISNELCSERYGITRKEQDEYAVESYNRSLVSINNNIFNSEIIPVCIGQKKGQPVFFSKDECPKKTSYETMSVMKPAFKKNGKGTAGNSSIISDGASAVLVMSKKKAIELGLPLMVEIGAQASFGIDLKYVLVAPIWAIPKCIKKEGIDIDDIDLYEINEAFSGSTCAVINQLKISKEKVNVNGGSVALGHPIGASGCRILVTLIHEMIRRKLGVGLASLCLGGGEAVSMLVKRV